MAGRHPQRGAATRGRLRREEHRHGTGSGRPHSRHRRRRRGHRPPGGSRGGEGAGRADGRGAAPCRGGRRRRRAAAGGAGLARHRQRDLLAVPRPGGPALRGAGDRAGPRRLRRGGRPDPGALPPRGGAAHRPRRERGGRGLRGGGRAHRAAGQAGRAAAALGGPRPGPPADPGSGLPAARRAAPRRRDAADRLPVLRERDAGRLGTDPGAGAGRVRGAVVGLLRGRGRAAERLARPLPPAGGDRHPVAPQPAARLALPEADGGQPGGEPGGGGAADQLGARPRRRRSRPPPRPCLGRGGGRRAARLPGARRLPPLRRDGGGAGGGGGGGRRWRRGRLRPCRALQLLPLRAEDGAADARTRA